jgi:hypothetical protein
MSNSEKVIQGPGVTFRGDDLFVSPDALVDAGYELPPDRPTADALIRIKDGVVSWYVLSDEP